MDKEKLPFVTVIVPNYNNESRLKKCLEGLKKQNYPSNLMEVIVIDNGSTDNSPEIIQQSGIIHFVEMDRKNPYVCRNIGITHAKGEIIVFLDSKCIPVSDWLVNGVNMIANKQADLVGGHVEFEFSDENSIAEITYSLAYLDNEDNVRKKIGAPTCNLFVHKRVIQKIGYFSEDFRSATDIVWTKKAIDSGFALAYAPKAVTFYLAKNKEQQLDGAFRDGISTFVTLKNSYPIWKTILLPFYCALPPKYSEIKELITRRGKRSFQKKSFKIWLAIWRIRVVFAGGMIIRALGIVKGN